MKWLTVSVSAIFILFGCLAVPTIPHDYGRVYDENEIDSIIIGKTTRADILLNFGEPYYISESERFMIYHWKVAYGYLIVYGAPPLPFGGSDFLCLEFGKDSCLVRQENLTGYKYSPSEVIKDCTGYE